MAQPLKMEVKGMPVSPRNLMMLSGCVTSRAPAQANCTSFHATPASASARFAACTPICIADTPS